ncbi:hypothetical protein ACHAWT_003645 [Skeletonema menzelii]
MNTIVGPSQAGTAVRATLNGLLDPIALAAIRGGRGSGRGGAGRGGRTNGAGAGRGGMSSSAQTQGTTSIANIATISGSSNTNATVASLERQICLMQEHNVDLLVLARYMQVLSPSFCARFQNQIINIHHSFLPAFSGGKPYHKAHERGVKLVGATAHYATTELDEGPIIEQDIMRVSHRDDVKDLIRKGKTLEKTVLTNAVKAHLDDRIITHHSKCIVFAE